MLFSERYGYKKVDILKRDEMPDSLRERIWNVFHLTVFQAYRFFIAHITDHPMSGEYGKLPITHYGDPACVFVVKLWGDFFHMNLVLLEKTPPQELISEIKNLLEKNDWYRVYDLIDFFLQNFEEDNLKKQTMFQINEVLKQENAAWRIVDRNVAPITSETELKELEQALRLPDKFKHTTNHLHKALEHLSDRVNPDYQNSVKESISALESMVQILLNRQGTLGELIKELNVHPALRTGFANLYGWTCDDGGIRHGTFKEPFNVDFVEAKYMLVTVSAFINYLKEKTV